MLLCERVALPACVVYSLKTLLLKHFLGLFLALLTGAIAIAARLLLVM